MTLKMLVIAAAAAAGSDPAAPPAESVSSTNQRVGGDLQREIEKRGEQIICGTAAITTPLPEGYPNPTPPGAIEIKHYPTVRRAQVERDGNTWWGMNGAFWPLFRHIQRRDIAMTSPVEMDYRGLRTDAKGNPDSWTMSFLYRSPEMGPTGKDRSVEVVDAPAVTVVSLGYQGSYGVENVRSNLRTLELWLASQSTWERDGEPRALFYNGPEKRDREKWAEVQVPVRLVPKASAVDPVSAPGEGSSEP